MTELSDKKYIPCEGGIPAFDVSEIHKYLKKVDGWSVEKDDLNNFYLIKKFKFENFIKSLEFVNKIGVIGEKEEEEK